MKILVAGDWHSDLHESEVCKSLRRLGHEPIEFKWCKYFMSDDRYHWFLKDLFRRAQNKYIIGPLIARLNHDFLEQVKHEKPDAVFIYRGTHIWAKSIRTLRREIPQCILVGYNNDDPFSPAQSRYLWRHFKRGISEYNLMLAYRHGNLDDFRQAGARKVDLMRSWYLPDRHYPVDLTPAEKETFGCDVVFVGHYENDGRLECLEEISRNGFKLRIFGPPYEWNTVLDKSYELKYLAPVRLVWRDEYNKALAGAKIALCFLSKLNRDTYTRRCFEIPATGTLLVSEYSDDLATIYREDVDAVYFRNKYELINKVKHYLGNDDLRCRVAMNGRILVEKDGHDIDSRVKKLIETLSRLATNGHY